MKNLIMLLFGIFVFQFVNAQQFDLKKLQSDIDRFKKTKDKLISVGFSTSEVKAKIGNPKSISGGFPKGESGIIFSMPDMVGQLNNSTWFYMFNPVDIEINYENSTYEYSVNGIGTDEETYKSYISKTEVFIVDGKLVSYDIGKGYKVTKSPSLKFEPLNKETTKLGVAETKQDKFKTKVVPVYCVIFDKGTQVVASTAAYFLSE